RPAGLPFVNPTAKEVPMRKRLYLSLGAGFGLGAGALALTLLTGAAEPRAAAPEAPKAANSHIVAVTVYQPNALVTREVDVPEGTALMGLVVPPLPESAGDGTLYSEGTDSIRVLTTRYRNRAVKEDTREDARKIEAEQRKLKTDSQKIEADMKALEQNMGLLTKLEDFTKVTTDKATEKGNLNSDSAIALSKYVMDERANKVKEKVELQQKLEGIAEQTAFLQRQLQELAGGSTRTERDAVIVVDKK